MGLKYNYKKCDRTLSGGGHGPTQGLVKKNEYVCAAQAHIRACIHRKPNHLTTSVKAESPRRSMPTGGTRGWPAGAMATPNTVKKFKYLINISI
jgi:hypothetical protein